jgi:hypothetical protein
VWNILIGLAVCSDTKPLPMDCYPCVLALIGTKVDGGCAIFMETQKLGLDLPRFGSQFCQEDNYVKAIVIWSKFWSINDFTL